MRIRTLLPALAVLVACASPLAAGESKPEKLDCSNAISTVEMNACGEQSFEKADAALNAIYKKALAAIPEMATEAPYDAKSWEKALRESQRAWVAFRDAECNGHVPMPWTGGTGATSEVYGCMTDKTEARTKELKAIYEPE
ncbi:MAG: lysozyme inhibitor LprI family protein [Hyphomicrobium sp.]